LLKGYGETFRRGLANYERIREALAGAGANAALVRRAREAALADPDGTALDEALASAGREPRAPAEAAE
jgi:indolepyruvate ferredoxin oxidoreductase beta subunit